MPTSNSFFIFMGLKHSGKSSLARMAGIQFGLEVIDLDDVIAQIGRNRVPEMAKFADPVACVRALYRQIGQAGFMEIEKEAAHQITILPEKTRFLAIGGGTMENTSAMQILQNTGFILFLDAPSDLLYSRILRSGPPAFLDPQRPEVHFQEIYGRRRSLGLAYANRILELGSLSLEEAFSKVQIIIKEFLHAR